MINALRSAFDDIWAVPIRARAGFVPATLRNLVVIGMAGAGLILATFLRTLNDILSDVPPAHPWRVPPLFSCSQAWCSSACSGSFAATSR